MSHPTYYKNLIGRTLCDEDMENIPFPRMELTQHITLKTTQAIGLIGALIAARSSYMEGDDFNGFQNRAFNYGKNGIMTGLVVGPLLSSAYIPGKSFDSIFDMCYRIRMNKSQVRADRFSIVGLAAGIGLAHCCGEMLEKGAVLGYIGGFFVGTFFNIMLK